MICFAAQVCADTITINVHWGLNIVLHRPNQSIAGMVKDPLGSWGLLTRKTVIMAELTVYVLIYLRSD